MLWDLLTAWVPAIGQNKQFLNKFDIFNICISTQKVEKEESSIGDCVWPERYTTDLVVHELNRLSQILAFFENEISKQLWLWSDITLLIISRITSSLACGCFEVHGN